MAEASGGRTHRRQENLPPAGFEDRDDHRTACASVRIIAEQHRLADSRNVLSLHRVRDQETEDAETKQRAVFHAAILHRDSPCSGK